MSHADVIVVGAGIVGLLTARELQRRGLHVVVFERDSVGRASSWAGGGILSPIPPWEASDAVTMLAQASESVYATLAGELAPTGIDIEYTRSGVLQLGETIGTAAVNWMRHSGAALEQVSGPALQELEPALNLVFGTAVLLPQVAQVRNPRLLAALHRDLLRRGVDIREHSPVLGLERQSGRITGVQTDNGFVAADNVVIAAGAWSRKLVPLRVEPVRGQMLWYRYKPGVVQRILIEGDQYLIPRRDGVCLVGSTVEQTGYDASTTAVARTRLEAVAARLCPALGDLQPAGQWAGLRPGSADGVPAIGEVPGCSGLFVNTGHFRNGITLAPASAVLLADLLTDTKPAIDPIQYSVGVQLYS
ncbi:MAG: glycine oxidase ThiO [Gammaproteobacteria bacterium]|nr:glycine oxidase ThiO [Gammaproteobacteria bacterium]